MIKFFLTLVFGLWAGLAAAQGTIILVVDTSSSMSADEIDIQLDSYASAMRQMVFLENVNIEVVLFNTKPSHISSGHRLNASDAFDSIERLAPEHRGSTCITTALKYVETIIPSVPRPVVVDISGDGADNCVDGAELHTVLDRIAQQNVRVNTLLVHDSRYQMNHIIRNFYRSMTRNGFTVIAGSYDEFEMALFEKLTLEIAQLVD